MVQGGTAACRSERTTDERPFPRTVSLGTTLAALASRPRFAPPRSWAKQTTRTFAQLDGGSGGGTRTHNLRINSPNWVFSGISHCR